MLPPAPVIYMCVILFFGWCDAGAMSRNSKVNTLDKLHDHPGDWTAEIYTVDDWNANLVEDNELALQVIEVFLFMIKKRNTPRCHDGIGCFTTDNRMGLYIGGPDKPEVVGTVITLHSSDINYTIKVDHTNWKQKYVVNWNVYIDKPLFALIHGFNFKDKIEWMDEMRAELMRKVKCNVLMVTWLNGARIPDYAAAASNSAMPGVLLSMLLQDMVATSNGRLQAKDIHVIGFSLGAQAAGFCGRHFYNATGEKLGRITGLDPAGPLFDISNSALSKNDATFVDVIHTNAGTLFHYQLGIKGPIGHVDFYPNGGSRQPGCDGLDLGCSHSRARELFKQSINAECFFTAYPCGSDWTRLVGKGGEDDWWCSQEMGYNSVRKQGRGNFYLQTTAEAPYCIHPVMVINGKTHINIGKTPHGPYVPL
ncbi:phospholipase A1-like isoform X2 [Dermacentor silvarum]|uniref:phospholipase A1-like isoform X2 n=1 Tax=Dermacentor silvarum TaxID=543639 RepID=UPI0021011836|nr:phospholipase A1-like isoform X2 [Dermacentor silvarum]